MRSGAVERERREHRQARFPIGMASCKEIRAWSANDHDTGKALVKVVPEYHIPAFSKWKDHHAFEAAFARLLDDLRASDKGIGSPPGAPPVSGDA